MLDGRNAVSVDRYQPDTLVFSKTIIGGQLGNGRRLANTGVDESIQQLFELVRQPSISAQKFGFDKAPGLMKEILERNGFESEIVPVPNDGLPSVYGYMPASENPETAPTLLFYCHYDVQPVDPLDLWDTDPFEPTQVEDRLYGRGMSDDKGNIGARLAAIRE